MQAKDFLLKVGGGRGFVVTDTRHEELPPLVITAAHCIPEMPAAHPYRRHDEETFPLLGPLLGEASLYATVLFYDPIADVAVLGQPDEQMLSQDAEAYEQLLSSHAEAYEQLLQSYTPLVIIEPLERGPGVVYDLQMERRSVEYCCWQGMWKAPWVRVEGFPFESGMSGSPVLDEQGRALAVVSAGNDKGSACLTAAIPSRIGLEVTS